MSALHGRLRRLAEELEEVGLEMSADEAGLLLLEEVDHALRPPVHERRVPSSGTVLRPATPTDTWSAGTGLEITRVPVGDQPLDAARRFTDGLSSWLLRHLDGSADWMVLDRPAGSERDLVVIARVLGGTVVQRHPGGVVRLVGGFGVLRWEGLRWHHEPPVEAWIDVMQACGPQDTSILRSLLEFAVHDLGAHGVGALLVYRERDDEGPSVEERLPRPPPLSVDRPTALAPLRHALSQVDGAAVFDASGVLRHLGVRLVPSGDAESAVDGFRGTRHTSGRRYSFDDPTAIVIAVSEDGPVTVFRRGTVLGRSDLGT